MSETTNDLRGIVARAVQVLTSLILEAGILFAGAGDFGWIWAWVFIGISVASIAVIGTIMVTRSPGTIAERGHPGGGKNWDKWIAGLWGVFQFIIMPFIAALDARLHWTAGFDLWLHIAGAAFYTLGLELFAWAMISNAYFSTIVRIQSDRGHQVCRNGPYRYVRHPGYSGTILQSIGIPILLGSVWALVPGFLAMILIVIRTTLEDRTLGVELEGYAEYMKGTQFRLLPGVW
ncbi:MAG TPA: isoprenylcysteine carboxylmethyltransferase family protein [Bacteroidota bacterium]|nr:isoprenylcysteine carboxylmethyltransferase family protein [Bacteroidota bacterium]